MGVLCLESFKKAVSCLIDVTITYFLHQKTEISVYLPLSLAAIVQNCSLL